MKKYLLPALFSVGIVAIITLVILNFVLPKNVSIDDKSKSTTVSSTVAVVVVPEIIANVKSVQFEDKTNGFKIWYPENSEIKYEGGNFLYATKNAAIQIYVSSTKFTGTNLGEAVVAVGVDGSTVAVAACQQAINGDQYQGVVTISGKDFSLFVGTDAGAGNLYDYRAYRRVQNGRCYEISEVLHSGNIYNYEPGAVKEFDKPYFSGILEKIATSFEFVN